MKVVWTKRSIFVASALRTVKWSHESLFSHGTVAYVPTIAKLTLCSTGIVFTITATIIDEFRITYSRDRIDACIVFKIIIITLTAIIVRGFKKIGSVFVSIALWTFRPGIFYFAKAMCVGVHCDSLSRGLSCRRNDLCWVQVSLVFFFFAFESLNRLKLLKKIFKSNFVSHKFWLISIWTYFLYLNYRSIFQIAFDDAISSFDPCRLLCNVLST